MVLDKKNIRAYSILGAIISGKFVEPLFIPFIALNVFVKYKIRTSRKLMFLFLSVFVYSLLIDICTKYPIDKLIQQSLVLFVLFISYDLIFKNFKSNIDFLYRRYFDISFLCSIIGLIQFAVYFFWKKNIFSFITADFQDYSVIRVSALFVEPGYLAQFLIPAAATIILSDVYRKQKKIRSIFIFLCGFLTFSPVFYFSVFLILVIHFLSKYNNLLVRFFLLILSIFVAFLMWNALTANYQSNSGSFMGQLNTKIVESSKIITISNPHDIDDLNYSSFALASNFYVAVHAPYRFLGTGLGSHGYNYKTVYTNVTLKSTLNDIDGYSLLNRILSEFGYVGLFLYLFWIIHFFNKKNIINISVLFYILSLFLRGGNYFMYGIVFFHFLYYYTSLKKTRK